MNIINISLSSNLPQYVSKLDTLMVYDVTTLSITIDQLYHRRIPIYMNIDWGDGNVDSFENDISLPVRTNTNLFTTGIVE